MALPERPGEPTAADWASARGDKWLGHLTGMEASLAPIDEPLLDALKLDAPCRIADVACGGGGTSVQILRRAPAGSVVHGFDISPALVEAARARAPRTEAIAFSVADIATAPAPQPAYDRLASRFGVMFFDDPPAAFARLARWLEPEGRFAFATWGPPADNMWMTSLRDAVSAVVDLPALDPAAPGPFRYARSELLLELLRRAGLRDLAVHDWRGKLPVGGGLPAAGAARFALASFSLGDALATASEAAREAAERALTERYAAYEQDGIVRLDACVHLFTGAGSAA
jgi:SAM-dependent methyltransferase